MTSIFTQVLKDIFSKDVECRLTYSYTWGAAQLGHISLGYFPTAFLFWQLHSLSMFIPALTMFVWIMKELFDYYNVVKHNKNSQFKISQIDLIENIVCALFYFSIGTIIACSAMVWGITIPIWISLFFGFLFAVPWLLHKIKMQSSDIPYQYRLSAFDESMLSNNSIKLVKDIVKCKKGSFMILGPKGNAKSELGIGIATEHIYRGYKAKYITFTKFMESDDNFNGADLVIIDDVSACIEHYEINQEYISQMMHEKGVLKSNTTYVWIVGDCGSSVDVWKQILHIDEVIHLV